MSALAATTSDLARTFRAWSPSAEPLVLRRAVEAYEARRGQAPVVCRALDDAIAGMPARARRAVIITVKAGARDALAAPNPMVRELRDMPPDAALLIVLGSIGDQVAFGRAGHRCFDSHRLMGLRQARLAVRYARRFGWPVEAEDDDRRWD